MKFRLSHPPPPHPPLPPPLPPPSPPPGEVRVLIDYWAVGWTTLIIHIIVWQIFK